jgi:hypothetical protein
MGSHANLQVQTAPEKTITKTNILGNCHQPLKKTTRRMMQPANNHQNEKGYRNDSLIQKAASTSP